MNENNQQNCIKRAMRGEPTAIAELYNHYWRAARATAYGATADINLSEDAASEAFYVALTILQDLKDTERFGPWLRTIVVRTAKRLATARSKVNLTRPQAHADTQSPGTCLEQQELAALIHEAVGTLSKSLREALSLFYFEGYDIKEAANFLDVPEGTLKRRLHDGRRQLRDAAEKIIKGTKPMNPQREQILQQLKDALKENSDEESLYKLMRQAIRLRPVPNELIREIARKHWADKRRKLSTPFPPGKEKKLREMMNCIYSHSERAMDPNHPVGKVKKAIQAALPEFQPWQVDFSQVDMSQMLKNMYECNEKSHERLRPPGFAESSHAAYIYPVTAFLLQDEDGMFYTSYELMLKSNSTDALKKKIHHGKRLSDTLSLLWKESETIELKAVEDLLRRLSKEVIPTTQIHFSVYEEPRYRAALRMQFGDNPIPAAIAGILNPRPEIYGQGNVASAVIYLEPWAAAQSGQKIELSDFSPLTDLLPKKRDFEDKKT